MEGSRGWRGWGAMTTNDNGRNNDGDEKPNGDATTTEMDGTMAT